MSSSLNRLAQRIVAVEAELAAARTPQLAHSSVSLEDGTEVSVPEGLQTAVVADQKADTAKELASGAASAAETAKAAADAAAAEALLAAEAGAAAQVAADDAAATAASIQTEVAGIPAQIAAAKSEAITTSAGTAQQKADAAQQAAIDAAALTAQAKADAAKAAALTEAAVTAQQKADAAAATAQAAAVAAAATDAQNKADLAKAAAINAAAADAKSKADAAQANAISSAATTAQAKADAAKQAAIDAAALDAKAKADAAQSAATTAAAADAKSKADAAKAAAEAAAKTYSDTVSSGAKADAIATAAADAKTKADAAEAAAKTAAAADAQAKADAAKAAAIAAAAADAQTKADVAKAAAINAAATDAKSKADAAQAAAIAAAATTAQQKADAAKAAAVAESSVAIQVAKSTNFGYRYTFDITVNGDHDKYYPVTIMAGDQSVKRDILVKRSYSEKHPPEWYSSTHGGGLTLKIKTNFGGWGGANYSWEVHELEEMYNPTFGGAHHSFSAMGFTFYLRGGGAIYHLYSDQQIDAAHVAVSATPGPYIYYAAERVWFTQGGGNTYFYDMPGPRLAPADEEIRTRKFIALAQGTDVRVTGWTKTGKTTIDGGKIEADSISAVQIAADAVTANELAADAVIARNIKAGAVVAGKLAADSVAAGNVQANSISAKQLVLADTSNMAEINEVVAGSVVYGGWTHVLETVGGVVWSKRDNIAANGYVMFRNQVGPVPFKAGDRLRMTFEAFADAAVTPTPYWWTYGGTSPYGTFAAVAGSPTLITTTPQQFTYESVVSASVVSPTSYLVGIAGALAGRDVRVRNVRVFVMNAGELIVDGAVTANKVAANAVTADKIEAGAVIAGKLAADAVAANNVQAGAIIAGKLAADAVAANNVQAGAIVAGKIAADGVLATNIVSDAILSRHVKAGEIEAFHIKTGSITAASGVIGSIDAAKITVNKITAAQMAVGTITAESGIVGSLSAAVLTTGRLAADTEIIAGDPVGSHARMTGTGFKAYSVDSEGGVRESVRMGTDTNDLFSVTDATGATVASISETGFGAFAGASLGATEFDAQGNPIGGVSIYGEEFNTILARLPKGVIASSVQPDWTSPLLNTQGEVGIGEVSWVHEEGRVYHLNVNGLQGSASGGDVNMQMRLRLTTDGSSPLASAAADTGGSLVIETTNWDVKSGQYTCSPPMDVHGRFGPGGATIRVGLSIRRAYGTGSWTSAMGKDTGHAKPLRLTVTDVGLDTPDTWLPNYMGRDYSGGTSSAPTPKQTYVKTYQSNGWATYRSKNGALRGSSSSVGDTNSKVYQGYSSSGSYNGDQQGLWTFPSITSDVGSGTISKVEVYLYAAHWYYNSGGTAFIRTHGYQNGGWPTGATPSMTAAVTSTSWPKPGGRWVTLPSSTYASWKSGAIRGVGVGPAGGTNLLYYGYFNAAAQLRVTYTK